ncbi:hypothetical protein ACQ143_12225 [Microbacterium sp. MC2]
MATTWMLMAVPAEDYDELKRMVDLRQTQRGESAAPTVEELRSDELKRAAVVRNAFEKHEDWPDEALRRLAEASTVTTKRFTQVMDLCVVVREETPDFPLISTTDVAQRTGMSVDEWRSACRKIGAHLDKHYPDVPRWANGSKSDGRPVWPLVGVSGRNLGMYDQLYVGITAEQARRWRGIRDLG